MKRKSIKRHKDHWEQGFAALSKFRRRKGHCCPPHHHMEGKFKLGRWIITQRYRKDDISVEQKKRLDTIGFVWNGRDFVWERGFAALLKFKRREGHCCPGRCHAEGRFMLGPWVSTQRYRKDLLPLERKRLLDAIGFVWDWPDRLWEQNFAALLKFKRREGHCRVPTYYRMCDLKLGYWVATQRRNRKQMSTERRRRLNKIGFVWSVFMRPIAYRRSPPQSQERSAIG